MSCPEATFTVGSLRRGVYPCQGLALVLGRVTGRMPWEVHIEVAGLVHATVALHPCGACSGERAAVGFVLIVAEDHDRVLAPCARVVEESGGLPPVRRE